MDNNYRWIKEQKKRDSKPKVYDILKSQNEHHEPPKGNPIGVCKTCGNKFKQILYYERNVYSSYDTCPSCRRKVGIEKERKLRENKEVEGQVATLPYTPFPWQQQAGDDFEKVRFQVIDAGNRCFTAGAFINGSDKPVEEICVGDFSFDGNGNKTYITKVEKEEVKEDFYTIKSLGRLPFEVTNDHLIFVSEKNENNEFTGDYVSAKELYEKIKQEPNKKLYLSMPFPKPWIDCDYWEFEPILNHSKNQLDGIALNEETAWLLGLYCAEGCYNAYNHIKITLDIKKEYLQNKSIEILEKHGIHALLHKEPKGGVANVKVFRQQFCRKVDKEIGHGSTNKQIPESILYNKNKNILVSFLKGYYAGDGCMGYSNAVLRCQTVSKKLAIQLQTAWAILGYNVSLSVNDRTNRKKQAKNIDYVLVQNEEKAYNLLGYERPKKKYNRKYFILKDSIYTEISEISIKNKKDTIYKLTSKSHELCANCTKNHNCGKDRYTIMTGIKYFVECLAENRHVDNPELVPSVLWWQIAPTEKMAKQNWRELKKYFPKEWVVACSDSTFQMETIGGGIIEVRSAYDPESLVGVGLDLVTITEAARIKDLNTVWANIEARLNSAGRGRKKDRDGNKYGVGKAIINSSPIGKNFFYKMYKFGQPNSNEYSSNWISYQLTWRANPDMDERAQTMVKTKFGEMTYEEDLRRKIGDRLFRQNYLADFLAMDGTVFKDFEEKCVINPFDLGLTPEKREEMIREWSKPVPYHSYVIGYDPATGSSSDTPAVVVRDKSNNKIVLIKGLYGKNYDEQFDEISYISRHYNYCPCAWLRTGHTAIENQLAKRGVLEIPLDEQGGKKANYIQSLERAIQNRDLQVLIDGTEDVQTFILEMNDYTEKDGKYSNEQQEHDDFVSACYAAYHDYSIEEEQICYCGLMGAINKRI